MSDNGQLYFNGTVRTMDPACPVTEAVAVKGGKIIAAGQKSACATALGKGFEQIDLRGRALVPGFMDTHLHPVMVIYFSINCDLGNAASMGELKQELRSALSKKNDDSWLIGLNFDEQNLLEKRVPLRHDLDEISRDRPIIILKHDGHSVFASTRAIEAAGITASTPNPEAGTIEREADGYPSGPFRETAGQLIMKVMPMPEMPALIEGAL